MTTESIRRLSFALLSALGIALLAQAGARAQPAGCTLAPDPLNPPERLLRCGPGLTIRSTPDARYRLTGEGTPRAAELESGALMIDFTPSPVRKDFQILTPHAIAAVRGTRWAVDVDTAQTSTLVLSGRVMVSRRREGGSALLRAGEGADVSYGGGPVVVKRWARKRVDALLARFGQ
jgi:ferric-dicitrate binding protein FerR (iron transport regulator)